MAGCGGDYSVRLFRVFKLLMPELLCAETGRKSQPKSDFSFESRSANILFRKQIGFCGDGYNQVLGCINSTHCEIFGPIIFCDIDAEDDYR